MEYGVGGVVITGGWGWSTSEGGGFGLGAARLGGWGKRGAQGGANKDVVTLFFCQPLSFATRV